MTDWQPDLYLQFKSERTQPSIDLAARIDHSAPQAILDAGCGPGNSTAILRRQWPDARVLGIDRSLAMIEKARESYPDQAWEQAEVMAYVPEATFDIVFSNAVIQWIPDHEQLLTHLHGLLSANGVLAVQIPLFTQMPLSRVIREVAANGPWKERTDDVAGLLTIHDHGFYYDALASRFRSVRMWSSDYFHVLENHQAILTMMRSTGMKPYLERLAGDAETAQFEKAVLAGIETAYPSQKDDKVILPFKRLFFIATK